MRTIRILTSFGGYLEQHDSPQYGRVIEVSDTLAAALCSDGRAEFLDTVPAAPEAAVAPGATERAVKPRAKGRR